MPEPSQTFANHARWNPIYHFIAAPILFANVIVTAVLFVRSPGVWTAWSAVVAIGVAAGVGVARSQALTVQNRLIRLEERSRLRALLPAEDHAAIESVRLRDLIALRFASDAEAPALFRRVVAGEFATPRDIKRAVRDWRPDHLRV
jgi:hypothetical protein